MSDSIKTFITDAIEYITNAEICQIHKTAQTRTVDATCVKVAFYGEYSTGPGFAKLRRGKVYFYNQKQQLPQS